jgi:methylmalonyl-CoA mutase N-terminal domain/subunit
MGTESKQAWEERTLKKFLEKNPERKKRFETTSGLELERVYTPGDLDYEKQVGYPGEYPFTRGVQPTMYRGRLWTMRQYAGFGTAEESNRRYKYLLEQGQTGLSIAFDLPTQMGYDSDDPMARGEVGRVGVAIASLKDMETLFHGIPLDKVSTSMTINSTAAVLLAFYLALAEQQGVPWDKLNGTIQNDILKEYVARGTYIYPPRPSMRIVTDLFGFCKERVPNWNTISISGYHMREAGCTAVQEVAFTLADGIAYVEAAVTAGLKVDDFGGRLSFFFCVHNNFLEEVAKFRAARRMWAKIMKERFGAKNARAQMLRFHSQTAGCTLTAQQPRNNLVRITLQALAAVLGGTQSLHTNSFDEALALPTEEAVMLALRTQQIIAEESGVADTIDPLGGAYLVERLTDRIEQGAEEYIKKIDQLGGAVAAIEKGFPQKEIQNASYRYQMEVEAEERTVVGLNKFRMEEPAYADILRIDPALERQQCARLDKLREERDGKQVAAALAALKQAAAGKDNLMPLILDAVRAYATLGEVAGTLKEAFGKHREYVVV